MNKIGEYVLVLLILAGVAVAMILVDLMVLFGMRFWLLHSPTSFMLMAGLLFIPAIAYAAVICWHKLRSLA